MSCVNVNLSPAESSSYNSKQHSIRDLIANFPFTSRTVSVLSQSFQGACVEIHPQVIQTSAFFLLKVCLLDEVLHHHPSSFACSRGGEKKHEVLFW